MRTFWQDLRHGARMLVKKPGFALIAVVTLGLGIGAVTAIFSVVDAVLLRSLSYKEPERIALVEQGRPKLGWSGGVSAPEMLDYIAGNETFAEMAGYGIIDLNLTGEREPRHIDVARVSSSLFPLLGVTPLLGRGFSAEEDEFGKNRVVALSEGLWRKQFGADPNIIGRVVKLDEVSYTVVGVMPSRLQFPPIRTAFAGAVDLWTPLGLTDDEKQARARDSNFNLIGRLKPGVTLEQAQANMAAIAARIERRYPDIYQGNIEITATAAGLTERTTRNVRPVVLMLFGAVGFVLLIACANIANLQLTRAVTRRKEMAIRRALGAGPWRIARQMLTESLSLSLLGGLCGTGIAAWALDLIVKFGPANTPRLREAGLDPRALGFALLVTLLTGVLFGLAPALQSARGGLAVTLNESGRAPGPGGPESAWLRNMLVILETALAVALLVGAGLLINSFVRLLRTPPGFNPEGVIVARTTLPAARYPEAERGKTVYRKALERIAALPGVQQVSVASYLPLASQWQIGFRVEGGGERDYYSAYGSWVSDDFFRVLGIQLKKGRVFNNQDRADTIPVVVINESMARRFWPGQDAIGKRIRWGGWNPPQGWLTVAGVVADVKFSSLDAEAPPTIYMPVFQIPRIRRDAVFIARTTADPSNSVNSANSANSVGLATAMRREIAAVDADLPVYDVRTMNQVLAESIAQRRFTMALLAIFACAALSLAALGLYGVVSYDVTQRTREIGIRMALGGRRLDALKLVVGQGMKMAMIGALAGLVASLALSRLMKGLLYGVSATDPLTFVAVALLLMIVALMACYMPARRATKVDPMVALRCE
ncbi:MAG: ABC transporter permease [Chloracidobacterium sp.]|nr:ABC transporter permease [Chloracidobacterium sp.]